MPVRSRPNAGTWVVAAVAAVLHLVVGFFYVSSGLLVPLYALVVLWLWWLALAWLLVREARRGTWWPPVIPVVALATWFVVLTGGERLLGWTG